MVIQTDVILPDLEAAQAEPDLELVWDSRNIWLHMGEGYEEQHLSWIIVSLPINHLDDPELTS